MSDPWLSERLGVSVNGGDVELGLRINPNRAHLLVSRLLGKHIPAPVGRVLAAGRELGAIVRQVCGQTPVVVGFAETATALGAAVASVAGLGGGPAPYTHTTRRRTPPGATVIEFREEHSHATEQLLAVPDDRFEPDVPLVLVDDELSTGRTAVNAIRALHATWPRRRYVLASLLDTRTAAQQASVEAAVRALGARVESVGLAAAAVTVPEDVLTRAAALRAGLPPPPEPAERDPHPTISADGADLPVHRDERTLVLGDEEFMAAPQRLAAALGPSVRTSATTRSPVVVVDQPGYPIRTALRFPSCDDPGRTSYAYNVAPSRHSDPGNAPGFEDIVFVTDVPLAAHMRPLLAQLQAAAARSVHVVTPRGADMAARC